MDVINALIESGMFGIVDLLLLGFIGVLVYFVFIKSNNMNVYTNSTIEGLKTQIEDEHKNVNELSKVVYQVRKELETERQEKWQLKEQVLLLQVENEKLKQMVKDLEAMVELLTEENQKLLDQLKELNGD